MSCSISLILTLTRGTHILFDKLRPEKRGDGFEKHFLHYASFLEWGFHAKPVFFFNIFSGDPHVDGLIMGLY